MSNYCAYYCFTSKEALKIQDYRQLFFPHDYLTSYSEGFVTLTGGTPS